MHKAGMFVLGLALATGCASTTTASRDDEVTYKQQKKVVTRAPAPQAYDRSWLETHSDGSAAGRIAEVDGTELELEPYASDEEDLEFRVEREVPLVSDEPGIDQSAIAPGRDVRVFYRETGDDKPEVIGIEVLDADEASRLREEAMPMAPPSDPAIPFPGSDEELPPSNLDE